MDIELKTGAVVNFYQICDKVNLDSAIISESDLQVLEIIVNELVDYVDVMFRKYPNLIPFYEDEE